jgi:hypothetical protein
LGLEAPQVDAAIMSIQSQILTARRNKETERSVLPGADEESLDGDNSGLVLLGDLEEMLVVEGLVFGGELLGRRRRQGCGKGWGSVVPPRGRGRRREHGGKGAEEDERGVMRTRRSREAARGEELEREVARPG